jgi:hypothetical protein
VKIDWSSLKAEEALDCLKSSPRIAGVWRFSDITQGYSRHLLWDPKKGCDVSWLTVARVWVSGDHGWYANYSYDGNDFQNSLGPFPDRFAAAAAIDERLESEGWKVVK